MNTRKAKITEENLKEAHDLQEIWVAKSGGGYSQAEFGEVFNIGNQSAVGQFLRGLTPLSLKAAAGFAKGLGCHIADFSPRLADQAAEYAMLSGLDISPKNITDLDRNEIELVLRFRKLDQEKRLQTLGAISLLGSGEENLLVAEG